MAITQQKEINFKLKNILLSGDHTKNEVQNNNKVRRSMESKLAGQGDAHFHDIKEEINSDSDDEESAYEESFCSEHSDEESESEISNATHRSSINEIPLHRFTNSNSSIKKQTSIGSNKKFVSTSKICDDKSFKLEDRIKCLSLNQIRPTKSISSRSTRKNMSFTNDQIMKIERDNEILLRKIMAQQRSQKTKIQTTQPKPSSSAINRRKLQRKIEEDNMILLQRLQQAKSCVLHTKKIPGFRTTYL